LVDRIRGILVHAAVLIVWLGALLSAQVSSNTPIEHSVVAENVYENPSFGIRWELPKDWTVAADRPLMPDHVLIRLLPSAAGSPESVELTYRDEYQWDEKTIQQMQNKGWESLPRSGYVTVGGGIPARRFDYKSKATPTQYLTTLSGPRHGYTLSLIFIAGSGERVQELMKSIRTLRVWPDWPPNAATDTTPASQQSAATPRVRISQNVSQAFILYQPHPVYSPAARKAHVEGSVVLLAHIGTDGKVENLYIQSGNALLIPSAIEAISQWKYKPYLLDGKPAEVETQISVPFTLR
jgi:TonB family protein